MFVNCWSRKRNILPASVTIIIHTDCMYDYRPCRNHDFDINKNIIFLYLCNFIGGLLVVWIVLCSKF